MTVRRTKIVATLGPASNSPQMLEKLILAGLDVARLNFSHGTPEDHKARAQLVRDIAAKHGRHVALLGDLQGPKIRIAKFANKRIELAEQTIALRTTEQNLEQSSAQRAQARLDARDAQIKQLQESMNAKQTERGTLVTFGDVLFDLDRSELKPGGMHNITKLAQFLQENPDRKVIVEGYTDSTGSAQYNQTLSERRANSVRAALIKQGVGPERIVAQGYGKEYPVASNSDSSGRAMNRRVEVTISNDSKPVAPRSSMGN